MKQKPLWLQMLYIFLTVVGCVITLAGISVIADGTEPLVAGIILLVFGIVFTTIFLCLNSNKIIKAKDSKKSNSNKKSTNSNNSVKTTRVTTKQNQKTECITRKDFGCTQKDYEEYESKLKTFLSDVKLPENFEEFLLAFKSSRKRYIISKDKQNFYKIQKLIGNTNFLKKNEKYLIEDDYLKQFTDILVLGFDEYGHGYFLLSFEKNKTNPQVIFIDNEIDTPVLLANNFEEFVKGLKTVNDPEIEEIDLKNDIILGIRFNFEKQPELEPIYKQYRILHNRMYRGNSKAYEQIDALEQGELSRQCFEAFNGKIKTLVRNNGKKEAWKDVIGNDYEKTDFGKRRILCGLLQANFLYFLPKEYYIDENNDYPVVEKNKK